MKYNLEKLISQIIIIIVLLIFFGSFSLIYAEKINSLNYKLTAVFPHDPQAFTQGLEIYKQKLYESTGLYGRSSLRKIDLKTGRIVKKIKLKNEIFGEGITVLNDKIYQLSWKENTCFVYDIDFRLIKTFQYQGQGWGLTNNQKDLIMSNGSETIFFRDPDNFEIKKKITVKKADKKINMINELEYAADYIYANLWRKNYIIKIDPKTGQIAAYLDLHSIVKNLKTNYPEKIGVLNGIAYDSSDNSFLITGKLWPRIYKIKLFD